MHAIVITAPGGPEVLRWTEVPDPVPGPGEVLIDIVASAVNRADLLQRQGFYPPPEGAPPYPGMECSGRVAASGPGVTQRQVGDEVCALLSGGGYAERVSVPAGQVLPVPDGLDLLMAAALPEAAAVADAFLLSGLEPGETVLVHGGASGIGTFAIQLARQHGAHVLCTAGSARKLAACEGLGADRAISYHDEDFVEVVREVTGGNGADVILDIMGASYLARNVASLAIGGRLIVIGLQGGRKAELDLGALLSKRASLHATSLRPRSPADKARIMAGVGRHVWPLVESGKVRPLIDRVLPMKDAAAAHRVIEAGDHIGKVLLAT